MLSCQLDSRCVPLIVLPTQYYGYGWGLYTKDVLPLVLSGGCGPGGDFGGSAEYILWMFNLATKASRHAGL